MSLENVEEGSSSDEEALRKNILSIWNPSPPKVELERVRGPPVFNVLTLCGVVIGVAAIFCSWFRWDLSVGTWSTTLWEYLTHGYFRVNHLGDVGIALFILGTIAALFSQMFGAVQIAGLAMVFTDVADRAMMGIGFYMGIFSAAVVLASVAFPIGPGFESGTISLRNRFTVFGYGAAQPERQGVKGRYPLRPGLGRLFRANGKWISLLVAVSIWSFTVVSYENGFFRNDPLLTQVEGGFVADSSSFGITAIPLHEGAGISMHDEENRVHWNFSNPELVAGKWCAVNLGYRNLGALNVSLTVVNHNGDQYFGPNDQLAVIAQNGTFFEDDVVYHIQWVYGVYDRYYLVSPAFGFSFVFHDGDLVDCWTWNVFYRF
jgi:hypothetical protein